MYDVMGKILESSGDEKYREFHKSLVPGIGKFYGVRMPVLREITKNIVKEDWRSFLEEKGDCFEWTMIRGLVIATAKMETSERLELTEMFIPEITNWSLCDAFCGSWKIDKNDSEGLWNLSVKLMNSDEEFPMRIGTVMMLNHFLTDEHIDEVLSLNVEKYHPGYYYRMGAAWTLSFCFIKYPEKTEVALFREELDIDIRKKAVRKVCDSFRVDDHVKVLLKDRLNKSLQ